MAHQRSWFGGLGFVGVVLPALLIPQLSPSTAHAYRTLAEVEGESAPIVWEAAPVVGLDASSGLPERLAGPIAIELERAAAEWNRTSCAGRVLRADRSATAPDVTVRYVRDWVESGFEADAAASTDLVLQSGPTAATTLVRATINLNGGMRWFAHGERLPSNGRDFRAVLVHEIGHALGLAHPCEPGSTDTPCGPEHDGVAMHPVYASGTDARLSTDEVEGICALYGDRVESPAACEQTDQCMEAEWCLEGRCVQDLGYGESCSTRSNCSSTYCIESDDSLAGGLCTHTCTGEPECPSGTECAPLAGTELNVCRPRGATATCSASPAHRGGIPYVALALLLALSLRKPSRSRRNVR